MAVEIYIKDFQSIRETTIVVDGFTVIHGANNSGKTSVMRAFEAVHTNPKGHAFVRHGADYSVVRITYPDGNSVEWQKGKKHRPTYIINGGKPIHPGQGVPPEVLQMGVAPIEAAGRKIWPQIAKQFVGQVFLMDEPGSVIADAVSDADRVGTLNEALRLCQKDQRKARSTMKVRREDKTRYEKELEDFEGLTDVESLVGDIEEEHRDVTKMLRGIETLTDLQDRLEEGQEAVDALAGIEDVKPVSTQQLTDVDNLWTDIEEHSKLRDRWTEARDLDEHLAGVNEIQVPDFAPVQAIGNELWDHLDLQARLEVAQNGVAMSRVEIDMTPVDSAIAEAEKVGKVLQTFTDLQARWVAGQEETQRITEELARKGLEKSEVGVTMDTLLKEMPECPVCGRTD